MKELFMPFIVMLLPVCMIIFGIVFMKHPPAKTNNIYSYNTRMAMQNDETWRFAHFYSGRLILIFGIFSAVVTVIIMIYVVMHMPNKISDIGTALSLAQILPLLIVMPLTESALKRRFDSDGNKRK